MRSAILVPSPRVFQEPLLTVLARSSSGCEYVEVTESVVDDIIREAGYDPDALSQYGPPEAGWHKLGYSRNRKGQPEGLARRITRAALSLATKRTIPLLHMLKDRKRLWKLTEAGRKAVPDNRNYTADFLAERMQHHRLYEKLVAAVSYKLPLSAKTGQAEDHVMQHITRMIERDSLRDAIVAGNPPSDGKLRSYVVNGGRNDIRDMGTNPVCRELYGARTDRERAELARAFTEENQPREWPLKDKRLSWSDDGVHLLAEVSDDLDLAQAAEDMLDFEMHLWPLITQTIEEAKPGADERYVEVAWDAFLDTPIKDAAEKFGVSEHRAASMRAEARRVLREARDEGYLDEFIR